MMICLSFSWCQYLLFLYSYCPGRITESSLMDYSWPEDTTCLMRSSVRYSNGCSITPLDLISGFYEYLSLSNFTLSASNRTDKSYAIARNGKSHLGVVYIKPCTLQLCLVGLVSIPSSGLPRHYSYPICIRGLFAVSSRCLWLHCRWCLLLLVTTVSWCTQTIPRIHLDEVPSPRKPKESKTSFPGY